MSGMIQVHDKGVEIIEAPDETLISLEMLRSADNRAMRFEHPDVLVVGTYPGSVRYQVVGWDEDARALKLKRQDA